MKHCKQNLFDGPIKSLYLCRMGKGMSALDSCLHKHMQPWVQIPPKISLQGIYQELRGAADLLLTPQQLLCVFICLIISFNEEKNKAKKQKLKSDNKMLTTGRKWMKMQSFFRRWMNTLPLYHFFPICSFDITVADTCDIPGVVLLSKSVSSWSFPGSMFTRSP